MAATVAATLILVCSFVTHAAPFERDVAADLTEADFAEFFSTLNSMESTESEPNFDPNDFNFEHNNNNNNIYHDEGLINLFQQYNDQFQIPNEHQYSVDGMQTNHLPLENGKTEQVSHDLADYMNSPDDAIVHLHNTYPSHATPSFFSPSALSAFSPDSSTPDIDIGNSNTYLGYGNVDASASSYGNRNMDITATGSANPQIFRQVLVKFYPQQAKCICNWAVSDTAGASKAEMPETCGQAYKSMDDLFAHFNVMHKLFNDGVKNYNCAWKHCTQHFSSASELMNHVRHIHCNNQ